MFKEIGYYKVNLSKLFKSSDKINTLLLGKDYTNLSDYKSQLKKHMFSALYTKGLISDAGTYILYDVDPTYLGSEVGGLAITITMVCNREILDDESDLTTELKKNYPGNRIDKFIQVIEELLINNEDNSKSFGIGNLEMGREAILSETNFYGRTLVLNVPDFSRWN